MSQTYRLDLLAPYLALPQGDKIQAECEYLIHYATSTNELTRNSDVWIDGDGGLRSKTTVSTAALMSLLSVSHSLAPALMLPPSLDRHQEGD